MEAARRPVAAAMEMLALTMRGKYGNRYGASKGARPMTAKKAPKDFVKGKGARAAGYVDSKGRFILQPHKLVEFVVPDLADCELKPYVAYNTPRIEKKTLEELQAHEEGATTPQ